MYKRTRRNKHVTKKYRKNTKKTLKRGRKTHKKHRGARRMNFRGGMNDLGQIFLDIVKNKKIYEEEGSKHDAQSDEYQDAVWKIEELTKKLKEMVGEKRANEIIDLVDEYADSKTFADDEIETNKAYYAVGNGGQGDYDYQNDHDAVIIKLRDKLGVDTIASMKRSRDDEDSSEKRTRY